MQFSCTKIAKKEVYMGKEKVKRKLLSPKIDIVFQYLFGEEENAKITKDFLEAILEKEITQIDLSKNTILRRNKKDEKLGILDIAVTINGKENCDIEMQMTRRRRHNRKNTILLVKNVYKKYKKRNRL